MTNIEWRRHGSSILQIACCCQYFLFSLLAAGLNSSAATEFESIREKTILVWLSLDHLDQRGVHVIRLDNPWGFEPNQNTLSFGDVEPRKWMLLDTPDGMVQQDQSANATETSQPTTLVQIAAVFEDAAHKTPNPIRIYRNGQVYGGVGDVFRTNSHHFISRIQTFRKRTSCPCSWSLKPPSAGETLIPPLAFLIWISSCTLTPFHHTVARAGSIILSPSQRAALEMKWK